MTNNCASVKGRKKGSPKTLNTWVKNYIYTQAMEQLQIDRETLADKLIQEIEAAGETAPTFETAIRYISFARNHGIKSLDKSWSIGACLDHSIPSEVMPKLMILKSKIGDKLTIRISRWFSYLFPELFPKIHEKYKSKYDEVAQLGLLYQIAKQYAKLEIINEITSGKIVSPIQSPDTSDIDNIYFVENNLSEEIIWENFINLFLPKSIKLAANMPNEKLLCFIEHLVKDNIINENEAKLLKNNPGFLFAISLFIELKKKAGE